MEQPDCTGSRTHMETIEIARVAVFLTAWAAFAAGHWIGDHWIQTQHQALTKHEPGGRGRATCLRHVGTYTATQAFALYLSAGWLGLHIEPGLAAAGLFVSAATHYFADRREPLR